MVFSKVGPNQSIEWGQIRVSKSRINELEGTGRILAISYVFRWSSGDIVPEMVRCLT
jgi:hypothetical protein